MESTHAFAALAAAGVNEVNVARWFGVPLITDVRLVPSSARASVRRGAGAWIALLVGGETIPAAHLREPAGVLGALTGEQLVDEVGEMVRARYGFLPILGVWVVADRFDARFDGAATLGKDAVGAPDLSALQLAHLLPALDGAPTLDVGSGSGTLALVAARRGARVRASDVDARALALGALGARINGVDIAWQNASLLDGAPGAQRLIVFNAPLCRAPLAVGDPGEETRYYAVENGDQLALAFLSALPAHLAADGEALMQVQLVPEVRAAFAALGAERAVLLVHFADAPDGTPHAVAWLRPGRGLWRVHIPMSPVCRHLDRRLLDTLSRTRARLDGESPLADDETWIPADFLELRSSRQLTVGGAKAWQVTRFGVVQIDDDQLRLLEALDGRTLGELAIDGVDRERLRALAERGLCVVRG